MGTAKEELKKAGKSTPDEENHEVLEAAKKFLKEHHFCLVQFVKASNDKHVLKHLTKCVCAGIKETHILGDEDPIELEEFHRICKDKLCAYLSELRSNCLTRLNKAVKDACFTTDSI